MNDQATFVRTVPAEVLADGDGRTLEARIAPYDAPATVADPPTFEPYEEMFVRGAFAQQTKAPDRVKIWLNFEHDQGLRGIVGHGVELRDRDDGLHATFRVHANADGDKALQLVNDGLLTGLSLEFAALRSKRVGNVVHRLRAHIDKVSLCRYPAYVGAAVLAVREGPGHGRSDFEPPPAMDEARIEQLARLGIEPSLMRAVVRKPWDGSPARFTDEQYKRSALFCRGQSDAPKTDCSLPVLEPNGDLNVNALGAAAAALAGARGGLANVSAQIKSQAARKLIRYYRQAGMEPPPSLTALAGR